MDKVGVMEFVPEEGRDPLEVLREMVEVANKRLFAVAARVQGTVKIMIAPGTTFERALEDYRRALDLILPT